MRGGGIGEVSRRRRAFWAGGKRGTAARRGGHPATGRRASDLAPRPPDRAGTAGAACGQVPNSGRREESWDWSRWMIDECIWETRDSLRSSVAPISFMVSSS
ncbi:hypothetical protein OJF2_43200 [Aquisphaera giovannonii]|uniref:Uncharacterized protein n=1 Tax=Aquisphaera giovannonii TaxID=406548 RepID=A0A5B9W5B4_9BACT|nr:hypothetical protein OJF2_43200 [Aquisphaera giovannonii]